MISIFVVAMENGLHIPFHPFIRRVLSLMRVCPAELTPNISINGFYSACLLAGLPNDVPSSFTHYPKSARSLPSFAQHRVDSMAFTAYWMNTRPMPLLLEPQGFEGNWTCHWLFHGPRDPGGVEGYLQREERRATLARCGSAFAPYGSGDIFRLETPELFVDAFTAFLLTLAARFRPRSPVKSPFAAGHGGDPFAPLILPQEQGEEPFTPLVLATEGTPAPG
ncbi:hypothetical protein LIER_08540 [Lithospermum erythrorhizon]|uniref:Uncharacterized protein n=1 Tax=Lithospermum erythrorhizon TaxID=34254 RepID=A0AAV3PH21_LITER